MTDGIHPAVKRTERVAWLLDESISVPGTNFKFGLDPLLGLLPGAGDVTSFALSMYVVAEAWLAGVSKVTIARMLLNVALDAGFGSIPLFGDAFDAIFKANERNVELLKKSLRD
ncbi:DUF4112 domain-containing protein [Haloarchaeobius sp. DFWS5]|uniref:DUF4112 domain-containing protein n=1 Tax=Haloarchaeobius sp. DFWS5 TaxID=3446114 RepID=UPI003EBFA133